MKLGTTVLLLAAALPAGACLWDTDTLAMEAQRFPNMVEVSVGRFERNPPLYYEMRLARVAAELKTAPQRLELYDDAGVACDRLGRDTEAIEWMRRKSRRLRSGDTDHRYRYLANLGTFHIHRWLRNGAKRTAMADAKRARDLIAEAIHVNPDAHFGRERYQLQAIDWILSGPRYKHGQLSNFLTDGGHRLKYEEAAAAAKGVAGLVVLGNGWESVDVYHALACALKQHSDNSLALLAWLRARELALAGKRSLCAGAPIGAALAEHITIESHGPTLELEEPAEHELTKQFHTMRAAVDKAQAKRVAFMLTRLRAGRHPDTDRHFWDGWYEDPLGLGEGLEPPAASQPTGKRLSPAGAAVAAALAVWLVRRRRRRAVTGSVTPN